MTDPIELELVRTKSDRRLYALADVGTLRLEGIFGRNATAEAGPERWSLRRSAWTRAIEAVDGAGEMVGEFHGRLLSSGGTLHWKTHEYTLRKASVWRERYALADSDRELALFDVKAWGRRPVFVRLEAPHEVEPGLLLFAAFVVRAAAEDSSTAAAGATTAATTVATTGGT
jgi:hypothetical protein